MAYLFFYFHLHIENLAQHVLVVKLIYIEIHFQFYFDTHSKQVQ